MLLERFAPKLAEAGLDNVYISVHSTDRELELKMTGLDCLDDQLAGMAAAFEAGINTVPVIVINKLNYQVLPETVAFFINHFPIRHMVLNYIDPTGKARMNKDVTPRYSDADWWIARAARLLIDAGKTFRIERVPLCYMAEFAQYNTEARRLASRERGFGYRRDVGVMSYVDSYWGGEYVKGEACKLCSWRRLCPGIPTRYADIYGTGEVFPLFFSEASLLKKLGKD